MPLTRDFKETIQQCARRDAGLREALLTEAVDALLSEDLETGKIELRDYTNATVGLKNWPPKDHQRASCEYLEPRETPRPVTSLRLSRICRKKKDYGEKCVPFSSTLRRPAGTCPALRVPAKRGF